MAMAALVTAMPGCGTDEDVAAPFALELSPEFVQGVIPGAVTGVLVTITDGSENGGPVALTAVADGAQVGVDPQEIHQGQVAEVTVIAQSATQERPLDITVTGRRGDVEETATRSTTVFAWSDDRADDAERLLSIFTAWLADHEPGLGIDPGTEFSGSFVAPGLLVVSHYLYLSEDWELGLSWHVMVPPDDWAEIYLRPRDQAVPTHAYRLESQHAALDDGAVVIEEVAPPSEVVR